METLSRRKFVRLCAAASVGVTAAPLLMAKDKTPRNKFTLFTKQLEALSYDRLAEAVAEMGFDGIEGTIRPGGHVTPERVPDDLPKFVEALKKRGLELTIMASGINNAKDPLNVQQLRVAAKLGVKRYRMKYFMYDLKKPVAKQLDEIRPALKDLVALNRELGLQAIYQNHSGRDYVGAPLWDLVELFKTHDPKHLAIAFDVGHATLEGTHTHVLQGNLVRPHLGSIYVKSFRREGNKIEWCGLSQGVVEGKWVRALVEADVTVPVNMHEEYIDHRDPKLVPEHLKAMRKDMATLKEWLGWV